MICVKGEEPWISRNWLPPCASSNLESRLDLGLGFGGDLGFGEKLTLSPYSAARTRFSMFGSPAKIRIQQFRIVWKVIRITIFVGPL